MIGGASLILAGVAAMLIAQVGGPEDKITPTVRLTLFKLIADKDFGRLPPWSTWTASGDHCWQFGASGNVTDDCGDWDLTASGSPRTGIVTGIPVEDSTGWVDWTSTEGVSFDADADYYSVSSVAHDSTQVLSVTYVSKMADGDRTIYKLGGDVGYQIRDDSGYINFKIDDGTATADATWPSQGFTHPNCCTVVADSRSADAAKLYCNGAEISPTNSDLSSVTGDWADYTNNLSVGTSVSHGQVISRLAINHSVLTLADHRELCGSYGAPVRTDHKAYADISWTQTGGSRCFQTAPHRATCFPGGTPAYVYSESLDASGYSGYGWVVEPGRTNRVRYSTAIDCTNWVCNDSGTLSVTTGQVAPDGSATATLATLGALATDELLLPIHAAYSTNALLYPRVWVKCSSGDLAIRHWGSVGWWNVDCSAVGGSWTMIGPENIGGIVEEDSAWYSDEDGNAGMRFFAESGTVTASVWAPTLTEVDGLSVIPTGASAVSTGGIDWQFDNTGEQFLSLKMGRMTWVGDLPIGLLDSVHFGEWPEHYWQGLDEVIMRDESNVLQSICTTGLGAAGAGKWSSWWDSLAGHAGLDVNGSAVTCGTTPSGSWQTGAVPSYHLSRTANPHTAIHHSLKIEDRP